MNNHLLKTVDLTKKFGGVIANNKINLVVNKGTITGLIGPNGSGNNICQCCFWCISCNIR